MNQSLDPIAASEAITSAYRRYLGSLLPLREGVLADELARQLSTEASVSNGPFVEMTPPFVHGLSLQDLVDEGVLSRGIEGVFSSHLPGHRPLYRHQEQAIRKAVEGRNLIIATGTGSGKTESFLVPILDGLVREREAGTLGAGVRALLLYPMNALANDQLSRLREVLADTPDITFGRYTGETPQKPADALEKYRERHGHDPLPNEVLSRAEMQDDPPHILLTNYAMLEYLLLRPRDIALFEGDHGGNWRFVVVDEAHVYDGIKGAEIAMLLRRLRERVARNQQIQFLASSATVGTDSARVAAFGQSLFGAPFEWTDSDSGHRDVVSATRRELPSGDAWGPLSAETLDDLVREDDPARWLEQHGSGAFEDERSMRTLQQRLATGPQSLSELARAVYPESSTPDRERALVNLIATGHRVRGSGGAPVLSARYHLFVSAIEGAFACMSAAGPHVRFSRHEECPECAAPMFELAACKRCGQLHFPGQIVRNNGFEIFSPKTKSAGATHWVLLGDHAVPADEDDDAHEGVPSSEETLEASLCMACGVLGGKGSTRCGSCGAGLLRNVQRIDGHRDLTSCGACGGRSARQIRRLMSGADATSAVIASALYAKVPTDPAVTHPGDGRRLLMFSDSRQQAAFAAPYLQNTYGSLLQRALIVRALQASGGDDLTTSDLAQITRIEATKAGVFGHEVSNFSKRTTVALWIHRELIEGDERTSLEGSSIASVRLHRPDTGAPKPLLALGLDADEAWALLEQLVQTLRIQGAVEPVEANADLTSEELAPRNRAVYIREAQSDSKQSTLSWVPSGKGRRNRRVDYLSRVLRDLGSTEDPVELLSHIWEFLKHPKAGPRWLTAANDGRSGIRWRVDPEALRWRTLKEGDEIWRCTVCRRPSTLSVRRVCLTNACEGRLEAETHRRDPGDHYSQTYLTMETSPLRAEEHTAQLSADTASKIQEEFLDGAVNVLSCSTTFEMGVDVGELQSVFLRNVPPTTANYVQRAGRAGRRTESAALVVTFAQMRSHDQSMFQRPENMISGTMRAPVVVDDNSRVDRRHAHSIVLAAFLRELYDRDRREFPDVDSFYGGSEPTGETLLKNYLRSLPPGVIRAVHEVLPESVHGDVGLNDDSWVRALEDLVGLAGEEHRSDIEHFREKLIDEAKAERFTVAAALKRVVKTLEGRQLFAYFSRRNVLPKYGFPVDTVELRVAGDADANAASLDLSRDLSMAINEYAPGGAIVAQGKIIESAGVYRLPQKELVQRHYAICAVCEQLEVSNDLINETCACGAAREGARRAFIKPEFGFVASRTIRKVGTSRPASRWLSRQYLYDEGQVTAESRVNTGLGSIAWRLSVKATMYVINEGVSRSRFMVCDWCGFGVGGHESSARKRSNHTQPQTGRECSGPMRSLALAHDYETDALVLELPGIGSAEQARSILYGLLAGACDVLEIARDDIDGTVLPAKGNALVLFDTVPAGAGLVRRIADELPRVVTAMHVRVNACDCGIETSCYRCLRVYRNQVFHDALRRSFVLDAMSQVELSQESRASNQAGSAELVAVGGEEVLGIDSSWSVMLEGAAGGKGAGDGSLIAPRGVPMPEIGCEVEDGIPVTACWPERKIALNIDLTEEDVRDLEKAGWLILNSGPELADRLSLLFSEKA